MAEDEIEKPEPKQASDDTTSTALAEAVNDTSKPESFNDAWKAAQGPIDLAFKGQDPALKAMLSDFGINDYKSKAGTSEKNKTASEKEKSKAENRPAEKDGKQEQEREAVRKLISALSDSADPGKQLSKTSEAIGGTGGAIKIDWKDGKEVQTINVSKDGNSVMSLALDQKGEVKDVAYPSGLRFEREQGKDSNQWGIYSPDGQKVGTWNGDIKAVKNGPDDFRLVQSSASGTELVLSPRDGALLNYEQKDGQRLLTKIERPAGPGNPGSVETRHYEGTVFSGAQVKYDNGIKKEIGPGGGTKEVSLELKENGEITGRIKMDGKGNVEITDRDGKQRSAFNVNEPGGWAKARYGDDKPLSQKPLQADKQENPKQTIDYFPLAMADLVQAKPQEKAEAGKDSQAKVESKDGLVTKITRPDGLTMEFKYGYDLQSKKMVLNEMTVSGEKPPPTVWKAERDIWGGEHWKTTDGKNSFDGSLSIEKDGSLAWTQEKNSPLGRHADTWVNKPDGSFEHRFDDNGKKSSISFDKDLNPTRIERADGSKWDFQYKDGKASKLTITEADGSKSSYIKAKPGDKHWTPENDKNKANLNFDLDKQSGKITIHSNDAKPARPGEWQPINHKQQHDRKIELRRDGSKTWSQDQSLERREYKDGKHLSELKYKNGEGRKFEYDPKTNEPISITFTSPSNPQGEKLSRVYDDKAGKYTDKWVDKDGKLAFEGKIKLDHESGDYSTISSKGLETKNYFNGGWELVNHGHQKEVIKDGDRPATVLTPDGTARSYNWGSDNKSNAPDSFYESSTDKTGKVDSQVWQKQPGTNLWTNGKGQFRENVKVDKDGTLSYTDPADGKQITKKLDGTTETKENPRSEDLQYQKQKLLELAKISMDSKSFKEFQENLEKFESRKGEPPLPPISDAEKAKTYKEISKLITSESKVGISKENQIVLAGQIMQHAANPTKIDQGRHPTCNATTIEVLTYAHKPSEAARLVADVALTGEYKTTKDGTVIKVPLENLQPDKDSMENKDGLRTYDSQIFQLTVGNIKWQKENPNLRFMQVQPQAGLRDDYGERIFDTTNNQFLKYPDGTPQRDPGFLAWDHVDVLSKITGRDEKGSTLVHWGEADGSKQIGGRSLPWSSSDARLSSINSEKQLQDLLLKAKEEGKLPIIVCVYANKRPFAADDVAGGGGGHVVSIWDIDATDPKNVRISVDNQWGSASDFANGPDGDKRLSPSELYRAMKGK